MSDNCCGNGTKLLYSCSGASDVGELADRVARKLWAEGFAMKTCLAGVGAGLSGFVESARGADLNIALDGCPLLCAKKSLELIGVKPVSVMLGDYGFKKGEVPDMDDSLERAVKAVKSGAEIKIQ